MNVLNGLKTVKLYRSSFHWKVFQVLPYDSPIGLW